MNYWSEHIAEARTLSFLFATLVPLQFGDYRLRLGLSYQRPALGTRTPRIWDPLRHWRGPIATESPFEFLLPSWTDLMIRWLCSPSHDLIHHLGGEGDHGRRLWPSPQRTLQCLFRESRSPLSLREWSTAWDSNEWVLINHESVDFFFLFVLVLACSQSEWMVFF